MKTLSRRGLLGLLSAAAVGIVRPEFLLPTGKKTFVFGSGMRATEEWQCAFSYRVVAQELISEAMGKFAPEWKRIADGMEEIEIDGITYKVGESSELQSFGHS